VPIFPPYKDLSAVEKCNWHSYGREDQPTASLLGKRQEIALEEELDPETGW
jgi:hypothetical protein